MEPPATPQSSGSPSAAGPSGNPRERREFSRYTFYCPARLHVTESAEEDTRERPGVQATVHSISKGGLELLSPAETSLGSFVHVYLHARAWNHDYLSGQIVRCRRYRDGWFEVGVQLLSAGSTEDDGDLVVH